MWTRVLGAGKDPHKLSLGEWESFIDLRFSGAIDSDGRPVPESERKPVRDAERRSGLQLAAVGVQLRNQVAHAAGILPPSRESSPRIRCAFRGEPKAARSYDGPLPCAPCSHRSAHHESTGVREARRAPEPPERVPGHRCGHGASPQRERHLADRWLREAETMAKLEPQIGSAWHAYRRMWATARKGLPVQDVAAAGGWKSAKVVQDIYQRADSATMLTVVLAGGEVQEARG